jgi:hypothetical protein
MTKNKASSRFPWKPLLYAVLALVGGVALVSLSRYVKHRAATTQPAEVVATAPADQPVSPAPGRLPRRTPSNPSANALASLMLLFGMACLVIFCVCAGWLVVEIRNSRPTWQRQSRFPKMRQ